MRIAILGALTICAYAASAQSVVGTVRDSAGTGIPRVRVLVHPVGDSSEVSSRIAYTNDAGEFKVALGAPRDFVVRVRRIGFAPPPDQTVRPLNADPTRVSFVLHRVAQTLSAVSVQQFRGDAKCVAMNDPAQSPTVREWFEQATATLFSRRVVERDFAFAISVTTTVFPARNGASGTHSYMHNPGATSRYWMEEDPATLATIGLAVSGGSTLLLPSEASLIYPSFRLAHCFDNVMKQNADGTWDLAFREMSDRHHDIAISGTLTFTQDGSAFTRSSFRFASNGSVGAAYITFSNITLGDESYPIVSARGSRLSRGNGGPTYERDERFEFSKFSRAR